MPQERIVNEDLQRGYSGTARTVSRMHELVAQAKLDPTLHKIATLVRLSVPEDYRGSSKELANAVFAWVKKHGIFQRDPFQIERIEHPIASMRTIIDARKSGQYAGPGLFVGDCDLFSIWLAALGGILGFQYAFETAKVDARRPDEFSHIWTALLVGREWYPLDASTPGARPGWRPPTAPQQFRRWDEKPIEDVMNGMNGHWSGMGEGKSVPGGYVPQDYFGYGIPKIDEWNAGFVQGVKEGIEDNLVPDEPAVPRGEMEPGLTITRKVPMNQPWERPGPEEPTPWPRPMYEPPKPYYFGSQPYPGSWPWARQVEVAMDDAMAYERRNGTVVMRPEPAAAGYEGLGASVGAEAVAVAAHMEAEANVAANRSSSNLLSTVTGIINDVARTVPGVTQAMIDAERRRYQSQIAEANARAQRSLAARIGGVVVPLGEPWYKQPLVYVGAAAAVGVGIFAFAGGGKPKRRGRRRRR